MRLIRSLSRRAKAKTRLEIERTKRGQRKELICGAMAVAAILIVAGLIFDASADIGHSGRPTIQRATAW